MGEQHYAAVTGDLVASRQQPHGDRAELQRQAIQVLQELNDELQHDLARPAVLTAGDEIQALFSAPSRLVRFVQAIKDRLFGPTDPRHDVVFGVGWGALSTGLLPEAKGVEQLDGACFHRARAMLGVARKQKTWVVFQGFGAEDDRVLTSLFELMGAIRSGWTTTQSTYADGLREGDRRIDVARHFGVSPSVITESLQLSHYESIVNGEETARTVLRRFDPRPDETGTSSDGPTDH
ncbi:MAG: hypothetical protein GY711_31280 [bacterium]|nr:hypothetical protein [bacterium]